MSRHLLSKTLRLDVFRVVFSVEMDDLKTVFPSLPHNCQRVVMTVPRFGNGGTTLW